MLDFEQLAACYQTTSRTVRRWADAGVDVADALAVANHLIAIQHPSPQAVRAVREILETELGKNPCHQLNNI